MPISGESRSGSQVSICCLVHNLLTSVNSRFAEPSFAQAAKDCTVDYDAKLVQP